MAASFFASARFERRGLVAQDMEAIFQRHLRGREVHVVRRDDGNEIHALAFGQHRLRANHLLESAVATIRRKKQIAAGSARTIRVRRKRAANEFNLLVDGRRDAMHRADEGAAPAADHAVTNFATHKNVR